MHVDSGLSNMNLSLCVFCKLIVVGLICLILDVSNAGWFHTTVLC